MRMQLAENGTQNAPGATDDVSGGTGTNFAAASVAAEAAKTARVPQVNDRVMTLKLPWLQKILAQQKTMELRSRRAASGFVWLAAGNTIYGSAEIQGSETLSLQRFPELRQQHCLPDMQLPYQKTQTCGLWLANVQTLTVPVAFYRLRGSCGWARVRFSASDFAPNRRHKS